MVHYAPMYLAIDRKLSGEFMKAAGGKTKATLLIMERLNCSLSKAGKIAASRYHSEIPESEHEELVQLMKETISNSRYPRQRKVGKAS